MGDTDLTKFSLEAITCTPPLFPSHSVCSNPQRSSGNGGDDVPPPPRFQRFQILLVPAYIVVCATLLHLTDKECREGAPRYASDNSTPYAAQV